MFIDPMMLRLGADDSRRAGEHAQEGIDALRRGPLSACMFGEFAAAEAFHEAISSARAWHVTNMQAHRQALTALGSKSCRAAMGFTDMDARNAAEFRVTLSPCATPSPRA
jgi:hypothetical protein